MRIIHRITITEPHCDPLPNIKDIRTNKPPLPQDHPRVSIYNHAKNNYIWNLIDTTKRDNQTKPKIFQSNLALRVTATK